MDPDLMPTLNALFGNHIAGEISSVAVVVTIIAHFAMPYLPVATSASSAWYRPLYGFLRIVSGNYRNAAPTPNAPVVSALAGVPPSSGVIASVGPLNPTKGA